MISVSLSATVTANINSPMKLHLYTNNAYDTVALVDDSGTVVSAWHSPEAIREMLAVAPTPNDWDEQSCDWAPEVGCDTLVATVSADNNLTVEDETMFASRLAFHGIPMPVLTSLFVQDGDEWGSEGGVWGTRAEVDAFLATMGWEKADESNLHEYQIAPELREQVTAAVRSGEVILSTGLYRWAERHGVKLAYDSNKHGTWGHRIERDTEA